jgi:hypothetical protein
MQPFPMGNAVASTQTGIFTRTRAPQRCSSPFGLYDMKYSRFVNNWPSIPRPTHCGASGFASQFGNPHTAHRECDGPHTSKVSPAKGLRGSTLYHSAIDSADYSTLPLRRAPEWPRFKRTISIIGGASNQGSRTQWLRQRSTNSLGGTNTLAKKSSRRDLLL